MRSVLEQPLHVNHRQYLLSEIAIMMTLSIFTDTDSKCLKLSELLLSVSPIVGGRVASFSYAILVRGTCLDNIHAVVSNRQVVL